MNDPSVEKNSEPLETLLISVALRVLAARVLGIAVVGQHALGGQHDQGVVLIDGVRIRHGRRGVVDRRDGDGDPVGRRIDGRGPAAVVLDLEVEGRGAVVVEERHELQQPVLDVGPADGLASGHRRAVAGQRARAGRGAGS